MTAEENSKNETEEEPEFEKITINTDYKIKTSLEEPLTDLELKPLTDNLEYVFLKEPSFLLVIISSQLSEENKNKLGVNNKIMLTVDILLVVVKESKKGQVGDAGAIVASVLPSFCQAILLTSRSPVQPHYQDNVGGKRSDSTARNGALL
ncbi:hypothetical protein Tco_0653519 [Tanacetum coccineum]|uniref:Uncharacterized protein n=1 Tax=Tanacetum coccineum TaxID=301880 RepID=A0ABQ4X1F5_9ASTR